VLEGDCWQHLRNIWFGAVIKELGKYLADELSDDLDLEDIHRIYRVGQRLKTFCAVLRGSLVPVVHTQRVTEKFSNRGWSDATLVNICFPLLEHAVEHVRTWESRVLRQYS